MTFEIGSTAFPPELTPLLLDWYSRSARELPWRRNPTPYQEWVSEIMLQQTRVETVKPYFERFLAALPDVDALADAPDELLLKLWEGLGYYSRARNLRKAARMIRDEFGGRFPDTVEELLKLPGIGDYTAGAIASIAFERPEPAVDGNVLRVAARLLKQSAPDKSVVREALRPLYPATRRGDFTQSLMELGALVCLPKTPRCEGCPVAGLCRARADGSMGEYPAKTPKPVRRIEKWTVLLLISEGRIALRRRPETGLLAGLPEFPMLPGERTAAEVAAELAEKKFAPGEPEALPAAKHIFSHLEWRMTGFLCRCKERPGDLLWVTPEELRRDYALPSAFSAYRPTAERCGEEGSLSPLAETPPRSRTRKARRS